MARTAKELVDKLYKDHGNNSDETTTTISLRLEPKYGVMLKHMSKGLNFPVATTFTDMANQHLFDMLVSLDDDEMASIQSKSVIDRDQDSVFDQLIRAGALPERELHPAVRKLLNAAKAAKEINP